MKHEENDKGGRDVPVSLTIPSRRDARTLLRSARWIGCARRNEEHKVSLYQVIVLIRLVWGILLEFGERHRSK